MHCNDVLFVKFSECKDSFTFPISLTPNTDYAYLLTDKFGNKYKNTFTSNSDGLLTINKSDFQDFTFTSASGNFTLSIKEHMNSCNNINFVYCDAEFESITFSFSKNHLNLMPTCEIIRTCLGISDAGNESSFLNEKGEFKTYQEILSNLPSYATQQDAIDDGNPNGFWYYNTTSKTITKIGVEITSYTAGTSTIDFTNNGGDDWDIAFKITPDTIQKPIGTAVIGYKYYIEHWVAGVKNVLDTGFKTTDYTYNVVGNGAGVYLITQIYVLDDSSFFFIQSLIVVDGSGAVLYSIAYKGTTINSVSGLNVDATANIVQTGVTYSIKWYYFTEFPPTNPPTLLGSGATLNTSIPTDSVVFGFSVDLGTEFTDDFPPPHTAGSTLSITIN